MLRENFLSLDLLDLALAFGLVLGGLFGLELCMVLRPVAAAALDPAAGKLMGVFGALVLAAGCGLSLGFVARSRVVYGVLLVLGVLGTLSVALLPPSAVLLYGLLRARGRSAFFGASEQTQAAQVNTLEGAERTELFRPRAFEQDETVLMRREEPPQLVAVEPTPEEEADSPDYVFAAAAGVLRLSGCVYGAGVLGTLLWGFLLWDSVQRMEQGLLLGAAMACGIAYFGGLSAACFAAWRGRYLRSPGAWGLGLALGGLLCCTGNLPLGALLLAVLLRRQGQEAFGMRCFSAQRESRFSGWPAKGRAA